MPDVQRPSSSRPDAHPDFYGPHPEDHRDLKEEAEQERSAHTPHSEFVRTVRGFIHGGHNNGVAADAALNSLEEQLHAAEQYALIQGNAYRSLEEQLEALDAAARRILAAPKGTSHRQMRFWLMDALGDTYPANVDVHMEDEDTNVIRAALEGTHDMDYDDWVVLYGLADEALKRLGGAEMAVSSAGGRAARVRVVPPPDEASNQDDAPASEPKS